MTLSLDLNVFTWTQNCAKYISLFSVIMKIHCISYYAAFTYYSEDWAHYILNSFKKYLFILCIWVHHCSLQTHLKRASDPIADGCEPPCGCWELNSGPLKEQSVLLTAEPSPQPHFYLFLRVIFIPSKLERWNLCPSKGLYTTYKTSGFPSSLFLLWYKPLITHFILVGLREEKDCCEHLGCSEYHK